MVTKNNTPSLEYINKHFLLDADNGKIFWKVAPKYHSELLGKEAGHKETRCGETRHYVKIRGKNYKRYRVIYYMHNLVWPGDLMVDHINRNPEDDRPSNLRLATCTTNNRNHSRRSIRLMPSGRYQVRLAGKTYGTYQDRLSAINAYDYLRGSLWGT